MKPLLSAARAEDEMRQKLEELEKTQAELKRLEGLTKELEEQNVVVLQQKNDLFLSLQAEQVRMNLRASHHKQLSKPQSTFKICTRFDCSNSRQHVVSSYERLPKV